MTGKIVRIGNSLGVRIPKPLLDQTGLTGEIDICAVGGEIVIRHARRPREGWEESFAAAATANDELLMGDDSSLTDWDELEWTW